MDPWRRHHGKLFPKRNDASSKIATADDDNFTECTLSNIFKGKIVDSAYKLKSGFRRYSRNSSVGIKARDNSRGSIAPLSNTSIKTTQSIEKKARAVLKRSFQNAEKRGLSYQKYVYDAYPKDSVNSPTKLPPYADSQQTLLLSEASKKQKTPLKSRYTKLNKSAGKATNDLTSITLFTDRDPYKDRRTLSILYSIKKESEEFEQNVSEKVLVRQSLIPVEFKEMAPSNSYKYKVAYNVCQKPVNARSMGENEALEKVVKEYFPEYSKSKMETLVNLLYVKEYHAGQKRTISLHETSN